ncbi:hypothetical protein IT418_02860 [bacterium]|nr:hypothetical protein [bacterium]
MAEETTTNAPQTEKITVTPAIESESLPNPADSNRYSRFITGFILIVIVLGILGGLLAITAPATFSAIINAFWVFMFALVLLFLIMGVLVMVGLKEQVRQILDIFVEGTLSIVDLMNFLKLAARFIIDILKQVVYFLIPFFAYLLGGAVYYILIYAYKWVGKTYDVTLFTIGLSALLIVATGFLNKRTANENAANLKWLKKVQLRFKDIFGDAVEVVLFVFFITMDSQNLFFLPKNLNIELHAVVGDYNFMTRGWTFDQSLYTTLNLVMAAVGIEVIRFTMRIVAAGFAFYKEINTYVGETNQQMTGASQVKWALRQSFEVHKDDVIRFITYTTFIIFVFLAFPRLKLLAMGVASLTSLVLDLAMRDRLVIKKGKDLFSKVVSSLFRV